MFDNEAWPEPLLELIKPELKPGERLLWASRSDRPSPTEVGRAKPSGWMAGLALGVVGLAFFAFGVAVSRFTRSQASDFFAAIGIALGLFSAVILSCTTVGAVWRTWARSRSSVRMYALTDARALIWDPMPRSSAVVVHTFPKGTIRAENLRRLQFPDGSGDVLFRNLYESPSGFFGVADVRRVEDLIRQFLIEPEKRPAPEPIFSEY